MTVADEKAAHRAYFAEVVRERLSEGFTLVELQDIVNREWSLRTVRPRDKREENGHGDSL